MQMFTLSASDAPSGIRLPQGEAKDQGTYKQAQGVVEVVKLEGPLAGDLLCVRPGSPAESMMSVIKKSAVEYACGVNMKLSSLSSLAVMWNMRRCFT